MKKAMFRIILVLALSLTAVEAQSTNEVRVRVNLWVGCVGGLVANGGLDTMPGSAFSNRGIKVSFKIIDDWTEGAAAFANNQVDVMLTTTDVWAKDYAQFREKGINARAFLMVDWSRGADGVIAKPGIVRIEDLDQKTIAFAPYTPSHFLLWKGLLMSGLTAEQKAGIKARAVLTKDGIEPATLFAQGKVDAAVTWDPDMTDAIRKRPGGGATIFTSKEANHVIADILVVSDDFAKRNPRLLENFALGWLEGVRFIKEQPVRAYGLIGTIREFGIPTETARIMLDGVQLSDLPENEAFFRISTQGQSDYGRIFHEAQTMYAGERVIRNAISNPEPTASRELLNRLSEREPHPPPPPPPPEPPTRIRPCPPLHPSNSVISRQPIRLYFNINSAIMPFDSFAKIKDLGSRQAGFENIMLRIEGNTDSSGPIVWNRELSRQRADVVARYLVEHFNRSPNGICTVGNGPDHPDPENDESTEEGRSGNRRTDIIVYREAPRTSANH
jgi:NitT/TauT family transport system substrate-binding protein